MTLRGTSQELEVGEEKQRGVKYVKELRYINSLIKIRCFGFQSKDGATHKRR